MLIRKDEYGDIPTAYLKGKKVYFVGELHKKDIYKRMDTVKFKGTTFIWKKRKWYQLRGTWVEAAN